MIASRPGIFGVTGDTLSQQCTRGNDGLGLIGKMIKTYGGDRRPREKIAAVQKKRLASLVKFARENSPFYRDLYAGIGDDFSLADLPPVSKPELMAHFDDVLTDRRVAMPRIDAFTQDTDNIGRMLDGRYLIFKTSGSTGNPAVVLYDKIISINPNAEKMEQNKTFIKLLHQSELEGKAEDVIHDIRMSSTGRKNMGSADWKQLYQAVDELYPTFKDRLLKELGTFTEQQMQVCYLMRIGLSKPQIQNMTNLARVTIWRWVKKYDWVFVSEE